MNGFTFGDKSSWDFSMHVEKFPPLKGPTRKRTTFTVAGRNGDLHIDEGSYSNYQQPYECYFHNNRPMPELAREIRAWLHGGKKYLRLKDTYDPEHFRLAAFVGPLDVENYFNEYGRCIVYFDCAPQSFLLSGENPILFAGVGEIHNPTAEIAQPLISVYGNGAGAVTIGDNTIDILQVDGELILDCETENAYIMQDGQRVFKNSCISAFPDLSLPPGDCGISFTGDISKIKIIPRWWET